MVQLHHSIDKIHAAGAELYVIGNGAPNFIEGFRELTGYKGPLYTDPSLAVYKAAQLKRGIGTILRPMAAVRTIGSLKRGFRQGKVEGDATQQGGVLVVAKGGEVLFHHISTSPGDNASPETIVDALSQRRSA